MIGFLEPTDAQHDQAIALGDAFVLASALHADAELLTLDDWLAAAARSLA